jgi:hypothetical protein
MENTNIIIDTIKPKKPKSEAQKRAQKKYFEKIKDTEEHKEKHKNYIQKIKDNEEYKEYKRQNAKRYYENNKQHVIDRVRQYQENKTSMLQLERLYILKNQGLITFDDSITRDGLKEMLENLKILGA